MHYRDDDERTNASASSSISQPLTPTQPHPTTAQGKTSCPCNTCPLHPQVGQGAGGNGGTFFVVHVSWSWPAPSSSPTKQQQQQQQQQQPPPHAAGPAALCTLPRAIISPVRPPSSSWARAAAATLCLRQRAPSPRRRRVSRHMPMPPRGATTPSLLSWTSGCPWPQ